MDKEDMLKAKVNEVINEIKNYHMLKETTPSWVNTCPRDKATLKYEFTDWLQFIFLPNCVHHHGNGLFSETRKDVALQAKSFLGNDPEKERLIQLLIELDALM